MKTVIKNILKFAAGILTFTLSVAISATPVF